MALRDHAFAVAPLSVSCEATTEVLAAEIDALGCAVIRAQSESVQLTGALCL
jgi:hypothetical protein